MLTLMQEIDESCCPKLLTTALDQQDAERLATALGVVADATRLRLLSLVASAPQGEACVCDLTAPLDLTQPTVSHHLKVLQNAGLVEREKRGRWAFYRVCPEPSLALQGALAPP